MFNIVHTAEIGYITQDRQLIEDIFNAFAFTEEEQENLNEQLIIYTDDGQQIPCSCSKAAYKEVGDIIPGIKAISVRNLYVPSSFKIIVRIEPNLLITGRRSIALFHCTDENKETLIDTFFLNMGDAIGYEYYDFLDLNNWLTERIDYTYNIHLGSKEAVKTFEDITKRTRKNSYNSKNLYLKEESPDNQSTASANKSSKTILYDKQEQIIDKYEGMPAEERKELIKEAEGIARFEVQCDKAKVFSIMSSTIDAKPQSRSFIDFLSESLSTYLLTQKYAELIGWGDFYSLEAAIKKIEESSLKPKMKEKLINFMRLADQSENIATLRENFIKGTVLEEYKDKNGSSITMYGSPSKYLNWTKKLISVGINAMPIARARNIEYFRNPVNPSDFNTTEE